MDRRSARSKVQNTIIVVLVLAIGYMALTDRDGQFSTPGDFGHAVHRVERGFTSMATWFADGARQKNRDMQRVHDDYEDRTGDRVEKSGGDSPQ